MSSQRPSGPSLRSLLPTVLFDALLPFLSYKALRTYRPDLPEVTVLALTAVFPAVKGLLGIVRRRRIDFIGTTIVAGIVVTIVAVWLGGGPKMLLIRESFVTAGLGVLALSSFAWRRPLMFYIGRQFAAGEDSTAQEQFNALWQRKNARRTFRVMTLVWAVAWIAEFALRVVMVLTLPVAQVLAISPIAFSGINIGLMAWTFSYARRQRARAA